MLRMRKRKTKRREVAASMSKQNLDMQPDLYIAMSGHIFLLSMSILHDCQ